VVGLGNPGSEFLGTRHNSGAEVAAVLADRHQGRFKSEKGLHAQVCTVRIGGHSVLLAVPQTFMNESGMAVAPLVRRAGIDGQDRSDQSGRPAKDPSQAPGVAGRLIIVHDELDLPSGRIRVKSGGGNAGNNGLKSIESHLHTNEYLRVRVGIGKPPSPQAGANHVLKRPGKAERAVLGGAVEEAADAVELIVTEGLEAAMNRVNAAG
jgi:PTH1 family peptidyl-tRNA hydrolase